MTQKSILHPLDPSIFPLSNKSKQWTPDKSTTKCMQCGCKFSGSVFKSGKHHCRKCGRVVCKKCCKSRLRKKMVCTDCYQRYHPYEHIYDKYITVPSTFVASPQSHRRDDSNDDDYDEDDDEDDDEEDDEEDDDEDEEEEDSDDNSNSASQSLLMADFPDGSPRIRKGSVTRIPPVIASPLDPELRESEDSVKEEESHEELANGTDGPRTHSLNGHANPVEDSEHHNTFQPNQSISHQPDYVANNLHGDIMMQSSSAASNPPSLLQVHQISIGEEGARLTSAAASPEPKSPTPSGSGPDKADLSSTTTSSGQKLLTQLSNDWEDEIREQLSSDNGASHAIDISNMNKSRREKKQQTKQSHHKKKRKRHSRREFERAQYKNQENMKFLHFNHININNNFINIPMPNSHGHFAQHSYGFHDVQNTIRLQVAVGMLKLYIEQLSIYTQRLKGINSPDKLKQIGWTEDDVWNAVKQRQSDEQRYMQELIEKDKESQRNIEKQQNEIRHRNIDEICNNIMSSDQIRQDDQNESNKDSQQELDMHKEKEKEHDKEQKMTESAPTDEKEHEAELKTTKSDKEEEEEEEEEEDKEMEHDIDIQEELNHQTWKPRRKSTFDAMESQLSDEENESGNGKTHKNKSKQNLGQILEEEEKACIRVGFEEIYESIVAYEYDIKSLCDLILQEIEHNESLHDEIHLHQETTDDFKQQLKSLQLEYNQMEAELNQKNNALMRQQQREQDLLENLSELENADEQNQQDIDSLKQQIQSLQHQLERAQNDENQDHNANMKAHQNHKQVPNNTSMTVNGDGTARLDINNMSEHDLSYLVQQLDHKLFGVQHELKQNEDKLKMSAIKQKQKYEEFLNKMKDREEDKEKEQAVPDADVDVDVAVEMEMEVEVEDEDEDEEEAEVEEEVEAEDDEEDDNDNEDEEEEDEDEVEDEEDGQNDQPDEEEKDSDDQDQDGARERKWQALQLVHGNDLESENTKKIMSILTYEKCLMFVEEIGAMKKWIKASKQNMRNLKSDYAQKHKYLKLQFSKFNDLRDDFYYQRAVLFQQRHRLNTYIADTERKINDEEAEIQRRRFEIEQSSKRLMDLERELEQKQMLLDREKADFDRMCRRQHQQQIDEELKNAQMLDRRVSEIKKKEKEILARTEELETTKKFLNKQKEIYKKERELIHQQQQQVFFNEKQLQKQQDLISSDQTYIQKEYIDAKESFQNDRFILLDKITKLDVQCSNLLVQNQSLSNQLKMKEEEEARLSDTVEKLEKEMFIQKQANNNSKQKLFECDQSINKMKQEIALKDEKLSKYEAALKENENKLLLAVQQSNEEKNALQSENKSLKLKIDELNDEIQILSANKKKKKKKKSPTDSKRKPASSLSSVSKRKLKRNVAVRRDVDNKSLSSRLKRENERQQRLAKYGKSKSAVTSKAKGKSKLKAEPKSNAKAKAGTKANAKLKSAKSINTKADKKGSAASKLKPKSKLNTKSNV